MSRLPSIAIVTPSFNSGRHIAAAVRSVLNQDVTELDYLVLDGGSSDGTIDILRGFGSRVRWISRTDRGQADAIRTGFALTQGDILAWLNADDTYAPGALRAVAEYFRDHPEIDVVYGNADYIDSRGRVIAPCIHAEPYSRRRLIHYSDIIVQPAAFFRRSAYDAVGGIDPGLEYAMDYDLWLRMADRSRFAFLPNRLASYRWLGDNKTAIGGWDRLEEIRMIFRRRGRRTPAYVRLERVRQHLCDAAELFGRRRPARAARSVAFAAATVVSSPRLLRSLISPHVWRVVWVGQVLRRRAVRASEAPPVRADRAASRGRTKSVALLRERRADFADEIINDLAPARAQAAVHAAQQADGADR